jgi:hypothetical protein
LRTPQDAYNLGVQRGYWLETSIPSGISGLLLRFYLDGYAVGLKLRQQGPSDHNIAIMIDQVSDYLKAAADGSI